MGRRGSVREAGRSADGHAVHSRHRERPGPGGLGAGTGPPRGPARGGHHLRRNSCGSGAIFGTLVALEELQLVEHRALRGADGVVVVIVVVVMTDQASEAAGGR